MHLGRSATLTRGEASCTALSQSDSGHRLGTRDDRGRLPQSLPRRRICGTEPSASSSPIDSSAGSPLPPNRATRPPACTHACVGAEGPTFENSKGWARQKRSGSQCVMVTGLPGDFRSLSDIVTSGYRRGGCVSVLSVGSGSMVSSESRARSAGTGAWREAGRARQPRWAGSHLDVGLTVTAHQSVQVPPGAVLLADRLQFVLRVDRRDRGAAAPSQDGHGDRDECRSSPEQHRASSSQTD